MTIISSVQEMNEDDSVGVTMGSLQNAKQNGSCDRWSWSERPVSEEEVCNGAVPYIGSVCRQELQSWQECVGLKSDDITVGMQVLDEEIVSTVQRLLSGESEECSISGFQFVCQFNYPLYDCSTNRVFLATREDCLTVSTEVCMPFWRLAIEFGFEEFLPNCDDLPSSETYQEMGNFSFPFIL